MPRVPVFKPGLHGGRPFTDGDIHEFVDGYDRGVHHAPVVIGHPKKDHPAFGWAEGLEYDEAERIVYANLEQIEPTFAEWVKAGRYKYISLALYPRHDPDNPTPGRYYLRHVGYLGGYPPSIKGLGSGEFAEEDFICLSACQCGGRCDENEEPMNEQQLKVMQAELVRREKEVAKKETHLAELRKEENKKEYLAFAERMAEEGRILPRQKDGLVSLLSEIGDDAKIEFAEEGGKTVTESAVSWVKGFIESSEKQVEFAELSGTDKKGAPAKTKDGIQVPAGESVDPESERLARRAHEYAEQHDVSFEEAVMAIVP